MLATAAHSTLGIFSCRRLSNRSFKKPERPLPSAPGAWEILRHLFHSELSNCS